MSQVVFSVVVFSLISLGFLIYGIISAVQTYKARESIQVDENCRREFLENIQERYIVDMTLVTDPDECGVIFYSWPGVEDCCVCEDRILRENDKCTEEEVNRGCRYFSLGSQNFHNFQVKSQYLCFRYESKSFIDILQDQDGKCDADSQKQCGNPSLPETIVCVGIDDECPIYQIIELKKEDPQKKGSDGWYVFKLGSSFLYFDKLGKTATSLPISQILVGGDKTPPGTYLAEHNINISRQEVDNSSLCSSYEHFSNNGWVDTNLRMKRQTFYTYNIKEGDFEKLKEINSDVYFQYQQDSANVGFYYKPYIPWNVEKRSQLGTLQQILDDYDDMISVITLSFSFQLVKLVYCDVAVNAFLIWMYLSEGKTSNPVCSVIIAVLNLICLSVTLAFTVRVFQTSQDCYDTFNSLYNTNLSTDFVQYSLGLLSDLADSAHKNSSNSMIFLSLSMAKFGVELIIIIITFVVNR